MIYLQNFYTQVTLVGVPYHCLSSAGNMIFYYFKNSQGISPFRCFHLLLRGKLIKGYIFFKYFFGFFYQVSFLRYRGRFCLKN